MAIENPKDILLVRTDHLGDLVLSLPAIFALKRKCPQSFITLVINARNESLVKELTYIDKVICLNPDNYTEIFKTIKKIRKKQYDIAVQLLPGNDLFGSLLVAASGAKHRIGYGVGIFSVFFNRRIKPKFPNYELDNVMDIMRTVFPDLKFCGWGFDMGILSSSFYVRRILDTIGINDTENIIIHPGTSKENRKKMWPIKKFVDLVCKINNNFKVKIFLIGTNNEKEITQEIKEETENVFDLCGMLSLAELLTLMRRSVLFIGNNSGPLQMAVALDIPTVSLMGPSLFERWAPKTEKHIVIQKKVACIPCEGTDRFLKCKDNVCMQMILVEEVFEAVKSQLNRQ